MRSAYSLSTRRDKKNASVGLISIREVPVMANQVVAASNDTEDELREAGNELEVIRTRELDLKRRRGELACADCRR